MRATENDLLDIIAYESLVNREELTRDATLSDLGIESLDVISVLFQIEDRYGVAIEDGEIPQVTTLGEMSDFLLSRINAVAA